MKPDQIHPSSSILLRNEKEARSCDCHILFKKNDLTMKPDQIHKVISK